MKCETCNNLYDEVYGTGRFCSSNCARKYSAQKNISKNKHSSCWVCKKEIVVKSGTTRKKSVCSQCKDSRPKRTNTYKCKECGTNFQWHSRRKTCSEKCLNQLLSKNRVNWLREHGTSNSWTKREPFSYGLVRELPCDSRLEEAAIIYLIDIFKATKICRYDKMLSFHTEEGCKKYFNTDFYVCRGKQQFLVEVKMLWTGQSDHIYFRYLEQKRKSLEEECKRKGYSLLWLDFNFDKKFADIYTHHLKTRLSSKHIH